MEHHRLAVFPYIDFRLVAGIISWKPDDPDRPEIAPIDAHRPERRVALLDNLNFDKLLDNMICVPFDRPNGAPAPAADDMRDSLEYKHLRCKVRQYSHLFYVLDKMDIHSRKLSRVYTSFSKLMDQVRDFNRNGITNPVLVSLSKQFNSWRNIWTAHLMVEWSQDWYNKKSRHWFIGVDPDQLPFDLEDDRNAIKMYMIDRLELLFEELDILTIRWLPTIHSKPPKTWCTASYILIALFRPPIAPITSTTDVDRYIDAWYERMKDWNDYHFKLNYGDKLVEC